MEYKIIPATILDKENIYNLKVLNVKEFIDEIWGWEDEFQIEEFNNDFKEIQEFYCIKNSVEEFIGYIQINEDDKNMNICELHLIEEYRNKGIGTKIISNQINKAKLENKDITLGCFKDNKKALNLYKKLGFKEIERTNTHVILSVKSKSQ